MTMRVLKKYMQLTPVVSVVSRNPGHPVLDRKNLLNQTFMNHNACTASTVRKNERPFNNSFQEKMAEWGPFYRTYCTVV